MSNFGPLDFLLIFFLVLGTVWGLLRGATRLLISLFSLYVGLILSLWLYRPLANYLRSLLPSMSVNGSEALAFVFLLLVLVNGFNFFTEYFSTPPEERKRKKRGEIQEAVAQTGRRFLTGFLSQIGGLAVGFVVTVVWISLLLAILQFVAQAEWPVADGVRVIFQQQLGGSALKPTFNEILALIYRSVKIWVPGEVPSVFAGLLSQF
jgi:uncharacterized membrane protein required for colicin V production